MRTVQRKVAKENFEVDSDGDDDDVVSEMKVIDIEEVYVKYKNFSFFQPFRPSVVISIYMWRHLVRSF